MTAFAQIKNPVVAYFDNADHAALMRVLRQNHPKTRIVVIDRKTMWCFREVEPRIASEAHAIPTPAIPMRCHGWCRVNVQCAHISDSHLTVTRLTTAKMMKP